MNLNTTENEIPTLSMNLLRILASQPFLDVVPEESSLSIEDMTDYINDNFKATGEELSETVVTLHLRKAVRCQWIKPVEGSLLFKPTSSGQALGELIRLMAKNAKDGNRLCKVLPKPKEIHYHDFPEIVSGTNQPRHRN